MRRCLLLSIATFLFPTLGVEAQEARSTSDERELRRIDDTDVFTRDAGGWHLRFTKILPVPVQSASN